MIHGVSILEDLVITLSDGIVSIYLELISVDSNFSDEMDGVSFSLCTLSTRALQRLRNEVQFENSLYSLVAWSLILRLCDPKYFLGYHFFPFNVLSHSLPSPPNTHTRYKEYKNTV